MSALTLPVLVSNYKKKQTVTQLKKVYSQLLQAVKFSEMENGELSTWNLRLPARQFADTYLSAYFKIDNSKSALDINKNIHYKFMDGSAYNNSVLTRAESAVLILQDGTFIFVDAWRPADYSFIPIYVDINGNKMPNTLGKDVFRMAISADAIQNNFSSANVPTDCEIKGDGCFQKILEDGWQIKYKF